MTVTENSGIEVVITYARIKILLDVFAAFILLLVLAPFLLLVALLVKLDSHGPALYTQKRVGKAGKPFTIYKFRTMKVGTPVLSTADMQQKRCVPFTRTGQFLRKTNIDELPQLFNIIKLEMSFIGPRPALLTQTDVNALREELGADNARPGITGLAQVMGRDDLEVDTKVKYDARYCKRMSIWFDLKILVLTIIAIFSGRGNK